MTIPAELKKIAVINALRRCRIFEGLPPADMEHIADITEVRSLEDGAYLFHEGDPARGFYVVQRGAVNVHRSSAAGKEQIVRVFRAGDSFAEVALASARDYPASARVIGPTQVLLVQKEGMLKLVRQQPELALRMLGSMSVHLRVLVGRLEDLTLKDVGTRLANWLVRHCLDPRSEKPFPVELGTTKRMLAAELGTVSETLSRALASFRDRKLVAVKGKTITVLSPAALSALLRRNIGE